MKVVNLAESVVIGSITDEHLKLVSEARSVEFTVYKIHAVLVNNVDFNKTDILNQIRAIPNVTVVTTVSSVSSKNLISVTEKTVLSIKFLVEHDPLEEQLDQIEQEAATIEGVREFFFDKKTIKKLG